MSEKKSKLYSIVNFKCPRCHKGDMFPPGTLMKVNKFDKMNAACNNCGQTFEPEPGYYFGAMFISYALNAALFIGVWMVMTYINDEIPLFWIVSVLIFLSILLLPIIFRSSRAIWINIFVSYQSREKGN